MTMFQTNTDTSNVISNILGNLGDIVKRCSMARKCTSDLIDQHCAGDTSE